MDSTITTKRVLLLLILAAAVACSSGRQAPPDLYGYEELTPEQEERLRLLDRLDQLRLELSLQASAEVQATPLAAVECVHRLVRRGVLPGGIASDNGYELVTGWATRPGQTRGVLLWRKQWQERERFTVTFNQNLNTGRAVIDVAVELQERPNDHYAWQQVSSARNEHAKDRATWATFIVIMGCEAR